MAPTWDVPLLFIFVSKKLEVRENLSSCPKVTNTAILNELFLETMGSKTVQK